MYKLCYACGEYALRDQIGTIFGETLIVGMKCPCGSGIVFIDAKKIPCYHCGKPMVKFNASVKYTHTCGAVYLPADANEAL